MLTSPVLEMRQFVLNTFVRDDPPRRKKLNLQKLGAPFGALHFELLFEFGIALQHGEFGENFVDLPTDCIGCALSLLDLGNHRGEPFAQALTGSPREFPANCLDLRAHPFLRAKFVARNPAGNFPEGGRYMRPGDAPDASVRLLGSAMIRSILFRRARSACSASSSGVGSVFASVSSARAWTISL
jgi:hypothetical protein